MVKITIKYKNDIKEEYELDSERKFAIGDRTLAMRTGENTTLFINLDLVSSVEVKESKLVV